MMYENVAWKDAMKIKEGLASFKLPSTLKYSCKKVSKTGKGADF